MNDAQTLFREGVLALKERKDTAEARRLLTESLRLNPQNEMAWLWLARTVNDPAKRLQCVERALSINPHNEQAFMLKKQLTKQMAPPVEVAVMPPAAVRDEEDEAPKPRKNKTAKQILTPSEERQIKGLLKKADELVEQEDVEGAIEQWVRVLEIQVDHEIAMRNAVGYLSRLKYIDDARELVWRAIESGTEHPSIYLTAIDIARHQRNPGEVDSLRERMAGLPSADENLIGSVAEQFIKDEQPHRAQEVLERALETRPKSQKLLMLMGDVERMAGREKEAMRYYDQAARLGTSTKVGREADKKLLNFVPVLTDRERGSIALAWREAAGFGLVFLLLGWQDAGLDLLQMDITHWLGVVLGLIGGYLVITATSSPQQRGLAALLGGSVPEKKKKRDEEDPDEIKIGALEDPSELPIIPSAFRVVFGTGGAILLIVAFTMVFGRALDLIANPRVPNPLPVITCDAYDCYDQMAE
jgi:tetratricopeptide (TPR) repeat protein